MRWSISKSKIFKRCPRQWFYSEVFANSIAKDPLRKEAYYLKKLKNIHAWRGCLVDKVISKFVIFKLRNGMLPSKEETLNYASHLMTKQLEFGKRKKYREAGVTQSNAGDEYCAFYELEYNDSLDEGKLQQARIEASTALENLLCSDFINNLYKLVRNSRVLNLISQRALSFRFAEITIQCQPDLIVFFDNDNPLIVDWKVHYSGTTSNWIQLATYALALSKVNPHKDFPTEIHEKLQNTTNMRLVEYQLLKNILREHTINDDDVTEIEDYIFRSITEIKDILHTREFKHLNANDFQTAFSPNICDRCNFKKLCWVT